MSYRYENLYIMHYGVGHDKGGHSGRYPWGSGKNPYGGVDPTTKKSDLFKLNGRKFNDVASDLIVKKKYGNRTDVTEQQIAQSKARTQAFLRGLEATVLTSLISGVYSGYQTSNILGDAVESWGKNEIRRANEQQKVYEFNRQHKMQEKEIMDLAKNFDTWSNKSIKTFDNSAKTWDDIPLSTMSDEYWEELEFNSRKNNW